MARKFIGERSPTARRSVSRLAQDPRPPERKYSIEEALDIFVLAKEAEGMRERTIADYRSHIRYLSDFLAQKHADIIDDIDRLTPEIIREYTRYLRTDRIPYKEDKHRKKSVVKGLAVSTINMRLRTLKTMCGFWFSESIISNNPMRTIGQMRDDSYEEVDGFDDATLDKILRDIDDRQYAEWRDKVLIYLMLDTGLRPEEAVTVTIGQFDLMSYFVSVPSEIAKNRKDRDIPITPEVAKMIKELHDETTRYFGHNDRVFVNAYGDPFTSDAFRKRLNRMKKRIGVDRIAPNMFRHTFARNYILNGGDIFTLQKILDHADIKTTRKYVQMDKSDMKRQHNKHSPIRKYLRR